MPDYGSFEIEVSAVGRGQVIVNGEDVTNEITRWAVASAPNEITTLQLELIKGGKIEGAGVIVISSPLDIFEGMREFLSNIDGKALEKEALGKLGFNGEAESLGEAMILCLKERLNEDQP